MSKKVDTMYKYIAKYNWDSILNVSPCIECLVRPTCRFKHDRHVHLNECKKLYYFVKFIKEYLLGHRYAYYKLIDKDKLKRAKDKRKE